jgi:hypothetical protein
VTPILKMTFRLTVLISLFALGSFSTSAQEHCGTVDFNTRLHDPRRTPQNDQIFENWLKEKATTLRTMSAKREKGPPYKIPVVVHVIHNGESLGSGANIPDAQILSQISVLNKDFRRLNTDANKTPVEFAPLAGSLDIEFVLAKQDPEGLPTDGIVRINGGRSGWFDSDDYEFKALSYWPAEDYLNIWVIQLDGPLVGYAKYPETSLPGIDDPNSNRLVDGVVIWHRAFGSSDDGPFNLSSNFTKGRTLTHELGHFFGLRHIWGDDEGCTADDFVNDTPRQAGSSSGCPTHPRSSCGTVNMFQNFMDYTADACMNLFTKEQVARMTTVLENSPRRASLLTSHGLNEPNFVAIDLGIRNVISPGEYECSTNVTPSIEVRNYGTNVITSAKIQLKLNNVVNQTVSVTTNLSNLETTQVTFTPVTVTGGNNMIEFQITEVNGTTDQNATNNAKVESFNIPEKETTPFSENFNSFPTNWSIRNPDSQITWDLATAPRETATNKAMRLNIFNYEDNNGEVDVLVSPVLDLSTAPVASLIFDVAFSRYTTSNDRLKVVVLSNCEDLQDGTVIYDKFGSQLQTVSPQSGSFVPTGADDWRREFVNLKDFLGQSNIQIAFVAINDWGNNLYLDNISVLTTELEDVELQGIESPTFITCDANPSPVVVVQNVGTKQINSLTIQYSVNGVMNQFVASNLNASVGDEFRITLPAINLTNESNALSISLLNPNGANDQSPANNSRTFTILLDQTIERIPTRQNFNAGFQDWKTFNPDGGKNWQTTNTNFDGSVYFSSYTNNATGEISWLVSPVLDFSGTSEASMVFDYSYRRREGKLEILKIYGSKDCGATFDEITTVNLSTELSSGLWVPTGAEDWTRDFIVDLSAYGGEPSVRIALAVINDNGNNLFLDNIEFFVTDNPILITQTTSYTLYGYNPNDMSQSDLRITFNLEERSEIEYAILDMMGKIIDSAHISDVLNQTYRLDESKRLASGTYMLRLRIGEKSFADRFLIVR